MSVCSRLLKSRLSTVGKEGKEGKELRTTTETTVKLCVPWRAEAFSPSPVRSTALG